MRLAAATGHPYLFCMDELPLHHAHSIIHRQRIDAGLATAWPEQAQSYRDSLDQLFASEF